MKIVQTEEASHHAFERLRHRGIDGVGKMRFAVYLKTMDGGMQSAGYLGRGPTESDPVLAPRAMVDGKSLGSEPGNHFRLVAQAQAEAISELFRCQPVVEVRRGRILQILEQTLKVSLLGRRR